MSQMLKEIKLNKIPQGLILGYLQNNYVVHIF